MQLDARFAAKSPPHQSTVTVCVLFVVEHALEVIYAHGGTVAAWPVTRFNGPWGVTGPHIDFRTSAPKKRR